jgi:hypothetical protein
MEDAKRIAVTCYRQVFEDGRDVCDSESDAEYSDHGEEWSDPEMYTPDMMNEKGKPDLSRARMTTSQENALRGKGRAPGLATVSGTG